VLIKNGEKAMNEKVQDAVGVLVASLESATSIAIELITMSGISTVKREKEKDA
jgi:hypothetical protein